MAKGNGSKKRKYKRKEIPKHKKAVICYAPQICPDVMRVQLPYNTLLILNGGGVAPIIDNVFRGNSVFDPDEAIGGQQPMGFDEWSNFYRRYRVTAAKVEMECINNSAVSGYVFCIPNNTSAAITSRQQVAELQFSKVANVGQDAGNNQGKIHHYMSTAQVRGGPQDIVQYESDLSALTSANPLQEWFWHIGGYGLGGTVNNFEMEINATITYYVEFYDRETLSRS